MKYIRRYTLPAIVGFLIFVVTCLLKPDDIPGMPQGLPWDKIAHFGMFFMLSAVIMYEYYRINNNNPPLLRWVFWGFVIPVIYGGAIELLQEFLFSYRGAEWGDWIADTAGSLIATLMAIFILRRRKS